MEETTPNAKSANFGPISVKFGMEFKIGEQSLNLKGLSWVFYKQAHPTVPAEIMQNVASYGLILMRFNVEVKNRELS